jgi:hypothetical protein
MTMVFAFELWIFKKFDMVNHKGNKRGRSFSDFEVQSLAVTLHLYEPSKADPTYNNYQKV